MLSSKFCLRIAFVAALSITAASVAISAPIDSYVPFVTTDGTTHTDIVTGGTVAGFTAYQSSSLTMTDGSISHLNMYDSTTAAISGGSVGHMNLYDSASATVSGGEFSFFNLNDSSSAVVTDGNITWLNVYENSFADVYRIFDLSWLVVDTNARVNLHADNVSYSDGTLSGMWGDGSNFSFWAVGGNSEGTYIPNTLLPNITIVSTRVPVPEPASAVLFAIGLAGFSIRRKFNK